jgi:hypothetical protein
MYSEMFKKIIEYKGVLFQSFMYKQAYTNIA